MFAEHAVSRRHHQTYVEQFNNVRKKGEEKKNLLASSSLAKSAASSSDKPGVSATKAELVRIVIALALLFSLRVLLLLWVYDRLVGLGTPHFTWKIFQNINSC